MDQQQLTLDTALSNRKNNFDFLRFIAATLVMFSHSYPLSLGKPDPRTPFLTESLGGLSVYIFFLISGFLVTSSFIRTPRTIPFLAARILRIFPALAVVLLLSVFALGPLTTALSTKEYFANHDTYSYLRYISLYLDDYYLPGVFSNNFSKAVNGSLWTLSYEFTCYLIVLLLWYKYCVKIPLSKNHYVEYCKQDFS